MVASTRQQLGCQSAVLPTVDLCSAFPWLPQLQKAQGAWEPWGTTDLGVRLMVEVAKKPTKGVTSTSSLNLCWEVYAFWDEMGPGQGWCPGPGIYLAYKVLAP